MFSLNAWVKSLKDEKDKTVLNAFIEIINDSNRNEINYGVVKEENFTINLCANG